MLVFRNLFLHLHLSFVSPQPCIGNERVSTPTPLICHKRRIGGIRNTGIENQSPKTFMGGTKGLNKVLVGLPGARESVVYNGILWTFSLWLISKGNHSFTWIRNQGQANRRGWRDHWHNQDRESYRDQTRSFS